MTNERKAHHHVPILNLFGLPIPHPAIRYAENEINVMELIC